MTSILNHFTPVQAAWGGATVGLAVANMLLVHGRVAGVSGIFSGMLSTQEPWRVLFVLGLVVGSLINAYWNPVPGDKFPALVGLPILQLLVAGLGVGAGARIGGGCTSGHGVCGVSRGSKRSIVATTTFVVVGAATAIASHFLFNPLSKGAPTVPIAGGRWHIPRVTIAPLRSDLPPDPFTTSYGFKVFIFGLLHLLATAYAHLALANVFFAGVTFALGLEASGMPQQAKVLGFLNPFSPQGWDPSLLLVLGTAIPVASAGYWIHRLFNQRPLLKGPTAGALPTKTEIDPRLVLGAALFGAGWGLGGLCPGPALTNLGSLFVGTSGSGSPATIGAFVAAMAAGMLLVDKVAPSAMKKNPGGFAASKTA